MLKGIPSGCLLQRWSGIASKFALANASNRDKLRLEDED
jgi:hypothetical protein